MRIQKINDNKLEIFINTKDLEKSDLTIQDFMSSSIHRYNFLFEILEFANKEVSFSFKNCEIILESFSIPSIKSFILTITRIPYTVHKMKNNKFKISSSLLVKFKSFSSLCDFCNVLDVNIVSNLFFYNGSYYLNLMIQRISDFSRILFCLKEFTKDYKVNFFVNENADLIAKNNAIEICKKFSVR